MKKVEYTNASVSSSVLPIFLLHDSLGCIELWRDFPEQLSAALKTDIYVYDRQGYGKSDPLAISKRKNSYMDHEANVLISILSELKVKNAVLFGHSDGATIALLAASKYPEKIAAVVSEAAHVFVEDITINGIKKAVYAYKYHGLKERLKKYHGDKTDLLFSLWSQTWLHEKFRKWNMFDRLSNIQCPVLLVQGENDEFGTLQQVDHICELSSGYTEKYIVPNAGHSPHKEYPENITEQVRLFLKYNCNLNLLG